MSDRSDLPAVRYNLEHFAERLGERFEIGEDNARIEATLIEARSLRESQGVGQRSSQFSLVWRGPPGTMLPQRIYTVRHSVLGEMALFLVCIGGDAEGPRFEAVFT
jgi:hypothetical protein